MDPVVDGLVQGDSVRGSMGAKVIGTNRRVGKRRGVSVVHALSLGGRRALGRLGWPVHLATDSLCGEGSGSSFSCSCSFLFILMTCMVVSVGVDGARSVSSHRPRALVFRAKVPQR